MEKMGKLKQWNSKIWLTGEKTLEKCKNLTEK